MKRNELENTLAKSVIVPVENDGTLITGITVDRLGYDSMKVIFTTAASSGTPTTATAALTVTHGAASNMSDTATFYALETAVNVKAATLLEYDIDLAGAKRYVTLTADITYVDGTSPKNIVAAAFVLGDKRTQPAATADNV